MKKCIITQVLGHLILCIVEGKRIERIGVLNQSDTFFPVGTIGIARIKKLMPNMKGAFVTFGTKKEYYLSFDKRNDEKFFVCTNGENEVIRNEDLILVQVDTEAVKLKPAQVSNRISLKGKYFIVSTKDHGISYSSKLNKTQRKQLIDRLEPHLKPYDEQIHIMVRTEIQRADLTDPQILDEFHDLTDKLLSILSNYRTRTVGTIFYNGLPAGYEILQELSSECEQIITDDAQSYEFICQNRRLLGIPKDTEPVFYRDDYPLCKLYSLETAVSRLLEKKVWLRSGGFLVIEQTEAMTVIDVNSGKNDPKKVSMFEINTEASMEIAYQLKARNLTGIIIVDFINMKKQAEIDALIQTMKKHLELDYVKASYVDMTGLGLMEITREKRYKTLQEQWKDGTDRI